MFQIKIIEYVDQVCLEIERTVRMYGKLIYYIKEQSGASGQKDL